MTYDDQFIKSQRKPKGASQRAIGYMQDLANQKDWEDEVSKLPPVWQEIFHAIVADANDDDPSPRWAQPDVSKFIDLLKKCEPAQAVFVFGTNEAQPLPQAAQQKLTDGMYKHPATGIIYKVYHTRTGHQVAKRLVVVDAEPGKGIEPNDGLGGHITVRFDYEGKKPLRLLKPERRLTPEEAAEFGKLYGSCCICGRLLTNELSIALGIGPVCGRREFGGDFEFMVDSAKVKDADAEPVDLDAMTAEELEAHIAKLKAGIE